MDHETRNAVLAREHESLRQLLPLTAAMVTGYIGLAVAAVGIGWATSGRSEPGLAVALAMVAAGAVAVFFAWRRIYRFCSEKPVAQNESSRKAAPPQPRVALRSVPGAAAH